MRLVTLAPCLVTLPHAHPLHLQAVLKVWQWEGKVMQAHGVCLQTLVGHNGCITCLTVLDANLISGGRDGTVRLWRVRATFFSLFFTGSTLQEGETTSLTIAKEAN